MNKLKRSHYCAEVSANLADQDVTICGWIHFRRDLGGLIFLEVRDKTAILQVVCDPEQATTTTATFAIAEKLRKEYVVAITGSVRLRPEGMQNKNMLTGAVELVVKDIELLNTSQPLPFYPDDNIEAHEDVRLKYRYLDLRRPDMSRNLQFRSQVLNFFRNYLNQNAFTEVETPFLTKSTPEGARDYLVPSRTQQGSFFALPQSPQLFKQLLMVAGLDKYFQVVRCFRDEDLRADRQPEFTQLDIEMSFVDQEDILNFMEEMFRALFKELLNVELPNPFPRMTCAEAENRFGIDRPDLRNPLELIDIAAIVKDVDFKVFADPANDPNGRVVVLRVPQGATKLSRKQIDEYGKFAGKYGAKGLAYIKVNDSKAGREGLQSPIIKNISADKVLADILTVSAAETGDLLFFGAGPRQVVNDSMAAVRNKLGVDLDLLTATWCPLWVVDFPMFEYDADNDRYAARHHPFTSPKVKDAAELQAADPTQLLSISHDLVLNGYELGGGSIRIHDQDIQAEVFNKLKLSKEEANDKFGFLLDALKSGCPPHGGVAFGVDRTVMLMCQANSLREVIAFPKTTTASCLMTQAPSPVEQSLLDDLGIRSTIDGGS